MGTTLLCPRNTVKMSGRPARFNQTTLIDTTPLPADIPPVTEIGSSSAPLLSASFFIGARCKAYNDDFMQCKTESGGKGEIDCLKEGRRVTRCAKSVIEDVNKHCLAEFRKHWTCLDNNNQQLWQCRPAEWKLNKCVFDNLVRILSVRLIGIGAKKCVEFDCRCVLDDL